MKKLLTSGIMYVIICRHRGSYLSLLPIGPHTEPRRYACAIYAAVQKVKAALICRSFKKKVSRRLSKLTRNVFLRYLLRNGKKAVPVADSSLTETRLAVVISQRLIISARTSASVTAATTTCYGGDKITASCDKHRKNLMMAAPLQKV